MSADDTTQVDGPKSIVCDYTPAPVCPRCGHSVKDEHDLLGSGFAYDGDTTIVECDGCLREFEIMLSVSYSFSTRRVPKEPRR